MYLATTRDIEVSVTPRFLPEKSSPDQGDYFWAYTIEITNKGRETVQLKTRHWRITDALGRLEECAAPAWWASSRGSRPASRSNTRAA